MQDDLFFAFLTVKEILYFHAVLRSPAKGTAALNQAVEDMITKLGLTKCARTAVGSHGKRGISGGERKRLAIGCELLSNPRLMFLDEPTSGLDSSTACSIIQVLKQQVHRTTVLCTIHQPSTKIIELFDDLMMLSGGCIVYFGTVAGGVDYYASKNFPCPPLFNPADHFLDVISADPTDPAAMEVARGNAKKLIDGYTPPEPPTPTVTKLGTTHPRPNKLVQFMYLLQRAARLHYRNRAFVFTQLVQNVFLAIMIGLVFLDLPFDQTGIGRRFASCFFITINQGVFAVYAVISSFPMERDIILRDRASGTYSTLPYFLSKSLAEIPLQVMFPSVFAVIVYFMIDYRQDFYAYANFWILIELANLCAISLGLATSAFSPTVAFATVLTPLVMEMWRLFSSFFSQPVPLPDWLIWIQYLGFITYTFTGLARNEIEPLEFFCLPTQLVNGVCPTTSGKIAIEKFHLMEVDVYQCQLILIGMILFYRVFAYFFVLKNKKPGG